MDYSPWDHKESDTTDRLTHTHTHTHKTLMSLQILRRQTIVVAICEPLVPE